jgi:hypothetical protein
MRFSLLLFVVVLTTACTKTVVLVVAPTVTETIVATATQPPPPTQIPEPTAAPAIVVAPPASVVVVEAPTDVPPPPPIPPHPSLLPSTVGELASQFFIEFINRDPYHPPGVLSCGLPDYHFDTSLWLVDCGFVYDVGYYPGYSPNDRIVREGLAAPRPYPTGGVSRIVVVEDKTGVAR